MEQRRPARLSDRVIITIDKREPAPTKHERANAADVLAESITHNTRMRGDFESPETQGLLQWLRSFAGDAGSKASPNGESSVVEQPDAVQQKATWLAKRMLKDISHAGASYISQEMSEDAFKIAKILCDYAGASYNKLNCSCDESTGQLKIELSRDYMIEEVGVLDIWKSRAGFRIVFHGGNRKLDKHISAALSG